MIKKISFDTIYDVWRNYLWPSRQSAIEPTSAMNFLGGYDLKNMRSEPTFFGYYISDKLVGVNSGHICDDKGYRSRGLYVLPEYRGQSIGVELLLATIQQGSIENANYCWSYPKQSSWNSYRQAGFSLASDWETSELDINAYCVKHY